MMRAASEALFVKSVFAVLGLHVKVVIKGDSSAAQLNAAKFGPGRTKHLEMQQMFGKVVVRLKFVRLQKVRMDENMTYVLTKHVGGGGRTWDT